MNLSGYSTLLIRSLAFAFLLLLAVGCNDPVAPGAELFAGSYSATEFRIVTATGEVDVLASGGALTLDIDETGSFQGNLTVPGNDTALSAIDTDIAGWWRFSDQRLRLNGIPDTLINDAQIPFRDDGNRLLLSNSLGAAEVFVVLTKD